MREEQKACFQCGALTLAAGMYYIEEKKRWTPSRNMIIAAVVLVLVLIGSMVASSMRTVPADEVVKQWFAEMVDRRPYIAENYVTPQLEQYLAKRQSDLRSLSDDYYDRVVNQSGTYNVSIPSYDSPSDPKVAVVTINGQAARGAFQYQVHMVKVGRQWLIDSVD